MNKKSKKRILKNFRQTPITEIYKALTIGDALDFLQLLISKKVYKKIFADTDKEWILNQLEVATKWIINDRIHGGIGKGGWGISERDWMIHVFGEAAGRDVKEAIFSTVFAIESLHYYKLLQRKLNKDLKIYDWNEIIKDLDVFFIDEKRFSTISGRAGKFSRTASDGCQKPVYDYRHTSLVLRLWSLSSIWNDRFFKTADILIKEFNNEDFVNWGTERVVTLIMAYEALRMIKIKYGNSTDLEHKQDIIRGMIVRGYDIDIFGWPAKSVKGDFTHERKILSRNYYTLLTLAMIPDEWDGENTELKEQMIQSLDFTYENYLYRDEPNKTCYISRAISNNFPDFTATLISFSAFVRKRKLDKEDCNIINGILRYILTRFEKNDFNYNDPYDRPYIWCVPFFVTDLCYLLLKESD